MSILSFNKLIRAWPSRNACDTGPFQNAKQMLIDAFQGMTIAHFGNPNGFCRSCGGLDDSGARVASGIYLYTLKAGAFTAQRKLVLMQ